MQPMTQQLQLAINQVTKAEQNLALIKKQLDAVNKVSPKQEQQARTQYAGSIFDMFINNGFFAYNQDVLTTSVNVGNYTIDLDDENEAQVRELLKTMLEKRHNVAVVELEEAKLALTDVMFSYTHPETGL